MRVLLVVNGVFFNENMGVLSLSAVLKKGGHTPKLMLLNNNDRIGMLEDFSPDIIAYSVMTPHISSFQEMDQTVKEWQASNKKRVLRIMGGPHPTYFPEVLDEMDLDAICIGEGEYAIQKMIAAFERRESFKGINNIIPRGSTIEETKLELIKDLDELPWIDRKIFYDAAPSLRHFKMRGVLTSRGCPYQCTYCFNHAFNKMFSGSGKVVRRRSVSSVINELLYLKNEYGPVNMFRFSDDTFAYKVDDWLRELLERYKKEIKLPFLCHLRSTAVTDEMVKLLKDAGCRSVGMSIETGNESYRNNVLKRKISDECARNSYAILKKYKIKFQANSMLGLPGTTVNDDISTFEFSRSIRPSVPTFGIFTPFPRLELTEYAQEIGVLDQNYVFSGFRKKSVLTSYTDKEKNIQINIVCLGSLFCHLPNFLIPVFKKLILLPNNPLYRIAGMSYMFYCYYWHVYWPAVPKNPIKVVKFWHDSMEYTD